VRMPAGSFNVTDFPLSSFVNSHVARMIGLADDDPGRSDLSRDRRSRQRRHRVEKDETA
jgi:hypothetical protein